MKRKTKSISLEKFIAKETALSRRKILEAVKSGHIKVNGIVIDNLTLKINPNKDNICLKEKEIKSQTPYLYYKFNKPADVICSMQDSKDRKDLQGFLKNMPKQLFPVGRLDRNTKGLLLFTNDGDFANKITHPKYHIKKTYSVSLDKNITKNHFRRLTAGLILADGPIIFSKAELVLDKELIATISEGRNRIVRRSFELLGYEVKKLKRIAIGPIVLGSLKEGKFFKLTPKELQSIGI